MKPTKVDLANVADLLTEFSHKTEATKRVAALLYKIAEEDEQLALSLTADILFASDGGYDKEDLPLNIDLGQAALMGLVQGAIK